MTTEVLADFGEQFTHSSDPQAIVYVPFGCITVAVNAAHSKVYPDADLPVFTGHHLELANLIHETQARLDSSPPNTAVDRCYCEALRAVDVLRVEDCAIYQLQAQPSAVSKGFDFFRSAPPNGRRDYQLQAIHGRAIGKSVMAIAPQSLHKPIVVENRREGFHHLLEDGLLIRAFNLVTEVSLVVDGLYREFLDQLSLANEMVQSNKLIAAKEILEDLETKYPVEEDRITVRNILAELLQPFSDSSPSSVKILDLIRIRGKSICDKYALDHAMDTWRDQTRPLLDQVSPPPGFDVGLSPRPLWPGMDLELPNSPAANSILEDLVIHGNLLREETATFTSEELSILTWLEDSALVEKSDEMHWLTPKGYEAIRKRNETSLKKSSLRSLITHLKPKFEYQGEVARIFGDQVEVNLIFEEAPEVWFFPYSHLQSIGKTSVGDKVIYRYYEDHDGAVSVLDPA